MQFVLVHGAWHGAWCWKRVTPLLRDAGHDVHAVTLTGVGERAHLLSAQIRLHTHVSDVLGVIRGEELDRDWVNRRMTPQPFGLYRDPLVFDPARVATVPRTSIDCNQPALANIDAMRRRVRSEPGWRVVEIATGHDAMISAPEVLARRLLGCAGI